MRYFSPPFKPVMNEQPSRQNVPTQQGLDARAAQVLGCDHIHVLRDTSNTVKRVVARPPVAF
jgi:hypothetical protein